MLLTPLPHDQAPGFTLTDQAGKTMPLSALRGKVVVLEFMDPHCTDICPIVSQEFVDAYHKLGPAARNVAFIAINVNQYHASVADMAAYSRQEDLNTIPSWHFFTGPMPALKTAWRDYNIAVEAPNPDADIVHTSALYFIDAQGREAFLASPMVDHTKKGTAYLPARSRPVGHGHRPHRPPPGTPTAGSTAGAGHRPVRLPYLGHYWSCRLWSLIIRWLRTSSPCCGRRPPRPPRSAAWPTNW